MLSANLKIGVSKNFEKKRFIMGSKNPDKNKYLEKLLQEKKKYDDFLW
jgi:hypothetical protein